jgi:hypothetical protein
MGLLKQLALSLVVLAICLAGAEVLLRLTSIRPEYPPPRRDIALSRGPTERVPFGFVPNAVIRSIYPSDPRAYFEAGSRISHEFNSAGWRDIEHSLSKPPNTYRILGLGDSYLFGQGVRFEDICLSRLQQLLQSAGPPGYQVEAINTGMSSFNTHDEKDLLATRGLAYDPDLVIVHFVLNDIEPDVFQDGPKVEFFQEYTDIYTHPDWLSQYSRFWGLLRQSYRRHIVGSRYIRQCLDTYSRDPEKFEGMWESMRGIQDLCRESHARLLVVIFPFFYNLNGKYPFLPIHDQLRLRCEEAGISVLDLYPFYRQFSGPELWVHPVDQHPNEKAHAIAAQAVSSFLIRNRERFGLYSRPAVVAAGRPERLAGSEGRTGMTR